MFHNPLYFAGGRMSQAPNILITKSCGNIAVAVLLAVSVGLSVQNESCRLMQSDPRGQIHVDNSSNTSFQSQKSEESKNINETPFCETSSPQTTRAREEPESVSTSSTSDSSTPGAAQCSCLCAQGNGTEVGDEEDWVSAHRQLLIPPHTLSRYRRDKHSAWDDRSSSIVCGVIAIVVITAIIVLLLTPDVVNVVQWFVRRRQPTLHHIRNI